MEQNLMMIKGNTLSYGLQIDGIGQQLDASYFTIRKDLDSDEFEVQKTIGDGIWFDHAEDDTVFYGVRVAPEDTEDIESGLYHYDWTIEVNGDVFTVLYGVLTIEEDGYVLR